jgi:HSP20 family protein
MAEKKVKKNAPATAAAAKPAGEKTAPKTASKAAAKKPAAAPAKKGAVKKAPVKKAPVKKAPATVKAKVEKPTPAVAPAAAPRTLGPVEEMEHLLENLWRRPFTAPAWMGRLRIPELLGEISPSVDIFEEGNSVVVKAEVPGMKRDDLDIALTEDTITITGHKKSEQKVQRHDFHRVERSFGTFTRRLRLPVPVVPEKARAVFRDGVLEITIPKAASGRRPAIRKITVE